MATRTIEVHGAATDRVTTDIATVTVELEIGGRTGEEISHLLADRTETVLEALAAEGVSKERIHTKCYSIGDSVGPFSDDDHDFCGSCTLTFDCRPSRLSQFGNAIIGAGGQISHVELRVGQDRMQDIQSELLETAVEQAHQKAKSIAAASNVSLGQVISLEESTSGGFSSIVDDALEASRSSDLSGGPVEVSAGVTVIYRIDSQ